MNPRESDGTLHAMSPSPGRGIGRHARRHATIALATALALLLPGLLPRAHARAKTDTVTLKNGNEITCEIVSLQRGKLRVKTDDMGTVNIEWDKVAAVAAKGLFEIEDLSGRLFYAPLDTIPDKGLQVATATGIETVPLLSVVRLIYIESSFWKRLSGSVDIGFGYTKSSDLAQFNADASVKFTRPTFLAELSASSYIQRQADVEDTTRNSVTFAYTRVRENRQFVLGQVSALQNRELGYDLRAGLTGAYGKYFVRSQGNELLGAAGLYLNREVPVEGETVSNLEALVVLDWANFSYDFPKTDIEVKTIFIVGLTDWGRYRVDVDARFDRELFSDFHLVIKGYYNYDSDPPTEGSSRDDFQVSLALGYKF
jgi:putative salt-induced outer membrane protein YdiY